VLDTKEIEQKIDGILTKIDTNDRLSTKLDGLVTKLDANEKVESKLDGVIEMQRDMVKVLEKLASAPPPAAPAPAVTPVAGAAPPAPAATAASPTPAPPVAPASFTEAITTLQAHIDYVWIIITGAMVFFMQAGFVMLEIGACRAKNTINIVMKSFLDFCICAIVYLLIGFPLMFGTTVSGFIGSDGFNLATLPGDHRLYIFFFFQLGFAGVSCTILSGAVAERTKFLGYLLYCAFFSAFIYPVIGHWAWGNFGAAYGIGDSVGGWLQPLGFTDYAGSSVVHACGGACSLAGILAVGPRVGRFGKDGSPRLIAGHNIPLVILGVLFLWFGWFGFNAGSSLSATEVIGRIIVNTTISPAAAGIAAMISMWFIQGKPDVNIAMNGALGGAVAITANCAVVTPAAAIAIGLIGGIITTVATIALERWKIDDPVGAVPVHLACGWWGTLCVALFNEKGFDIKLLGVQALGTASISIYSFVVASIFFAVVKLVLPLRATEEEQINGLDFTEHAANAYPDFHTTEQA
jgi:Amt family ammonium transporter